MAYRYDEKLIVSSRHVERYFYLDKYVWVNFKRRERKPKDKGKPQVCKSKFSISRTRNDIKRLVNSNPQLSTFLTLTYNQEILDVKSSYPIFMKFIQRMSYKFPDWAYVAVVEFQPISKRVHYHVVCNYQLPVFESKYYKKKMERWFANRYWKNGFVNFKPTHDVENLGVYLCKYLSKDAHDQRLYGKKKFFCSRNLQKPTTLTGYEAYKFIQKNNLEQTTPKYKTRFNNEYLGRVDYSAYVLDFIPPLPKKPTPFDKTILRLKMFGLIPPNYEQ